MLNVSSHLMLLFEDVAEQRFRGSTLFRASRACQFFADSCEAGRPGLYFMRQKHSPGVTTWSPSLLKVVY
jgi:hypothetical protein